MKIEFECGAAFIQAENKDEEKQLQAFYADNKEYLECFSLKSAADKDKKAAKGQSYSLTFTCHEE